MLKSVKYGFIYLAMLLVLSHNLIPHQHKSQVTVEQDAALHQSEDFSIVDVLALLFHEFTEDGQMEDFVSQHQHINLDFNVVKELISSFKYFSLDVQSIIFESSLHKFEQLIFNESIDLDTGIRTSWGVRPPPVA